MTPVAERGSRLWLGVEPLVLASRSRARLAILASLGIPVEVCASHIDERQIEAPAVAAGALPDEIALLLATSKAQRVSAERRSRVVLAADQVLAFEDKILHKPINRDELRDRLRMMSGLSHSLHAAAVLARDGRVIFESRDTAVLTFRRFSAEFVASYLDAAGESAFSSATGYEIEGLGMQLMERIEGQYATILGMPILPILDRLRRLGLLVA